MCPDKSYTDTRVGSGAPWLAVPKVSFMMKQVMLSYWKCDPRASQEKSARNVAVN